MKLHKQFIGFSIIVCMLFACALSYAQTSKKIPMRDFFKNPEKTAFLISPDGKYISHVEPYERRMNIFVQKTSPLLTATYPDIFGKVMTVCYL
jgi:hypothetical protein